MTTLTVLAQVASTGDTRATAELLRAVAPRISAAVRAVLGASHPDRDDAIQQSLIALVQALPAFRGDCEPTGYARVIAVRTALAMRRRVRARTVAESAEAAADTFPTAKERIKARIEADPRLLDALGSEAL